MKFARLVYLIAAVWGFLILPPMYFLEQRIGHDTPPPITHPEYFYGFIGVGLAWQVLFLIIAIDPVRLRPAMIASWFEKFGFTTTAAYLFVHGRVGFQTLFFSLLDFILGLLFVVAFFKTRAEAKARAAAA